MALSRVATHPAATVSTLLARQLRNAHGALREGGMSYREADDTLRTTVMEFLAEQSVCAIDGMEAEYALACFALDEAFARRGHRGSVSPSAVPVRKSYDWIVCGYDLRKLAIGTGATLLLLAGVSGR